MDKAQIQKSLITFTKRVKEKFRPKQVLLFGSYTCGEATDYSDVDVVVVADSFKLIPFENRLDALYPLFSDLYPDFHVFGYTSEEFENMSSAVSIIEAKTNGFPLL